MSEHVGRPTLEQVAALAGTSRATASRVVNRNTKVSPAVRRAVERAVKELGYTPNRAARSLVTRRSDSIGLLVTESEERIFGEPFFASLIRGVSDALAETDIQLVLLLSRSVEERARVQRFLSTHLDGVLLVSAHAEEPLLEPLVAGQAPGRARRPAAAANDVGPTSTSTTSVAPPWPSRTCSSAAAGGSRPSRAAGHGGGHRPTGRLPRCARRCGRRRDAGRGRRLQ